MTTDFIIDHYFGNTHFTLLMFNSNSDIKTSNNAK